MMRDIVSAAVASTSDMRIAGYCSNADLQQAVEREHPDVVIVGRTGDPLDPLLTQLLVTDPRLKVVVMSAGGENATLLELRRSFVADPSPAMLVEAIRRAVEADS